MNDVLLAHAVFRSERTTIVLLSMLVYVPLLLPSLFFLFLIILTTANEEEEEEERSHSLTHLLTHPPKGASGQPPPRYATGTQGKCW